MNAQQQAHAFLSQLYGDAAPGYLLLWTLSDKRSHWLPARNLYEVARRATELAYVDQVYFGCGLHAEALGPHERGEAEHVRTIPGLWADLDYGTTGHRSTRNPPTLEDALWIVRTFPLPVSVVVHSGYGLHAWWLFRELWTFADDAEWREAQQLLTAFQATLQQRARERGWHLDSTFSLAQVLRLPGTWNRKLEPVQVRILEQQDWARYSPEEFEPYLVDVSAWERAEAVELPADLPKVNVLALRLSPWLRTLILKGDTEQHYDTRSEAGWRVLRELVAAKLDDATIAAIFLDPRYAIGEKAREQGRDWLAGEIGRARTKPTKSAPDLAHGRSRLVTRSDGQQARRLLAPVRPVTWPLMPAPSSEGAA